MQLLEDEDQRRLASMGLPYLISRSRLEKLMVGTTQREDDLLYALAYFFGPHSPAQKLPHSGLGWLTFSEVRSLRQLYETLKGHKQNANKENASSKSLSNL